MSVWLLIAVPWIILLVVLCVVAVRLYPRPVAPVDSVNGGGESTATTSRSAVDGADAASVPPPPER